MTNLPCRLFAALALLAGVAGAFSPGSAQAAQSYDSCTGFIDSLPATVSQQGVWCLRKDLSTAISSGEAIRITNNNVTIDCNDFKVGGLAGGTSTNAIGIFSTAGRRNATIRNCNVRGFNTGIHLSGAGSGHLVEDNLVDYSSEVGIQVDGEGSRAQRNRVFDTGGPKTHSIVGQGTLGTALGMRVAGDVLDNVVTNLVPTSDANIMSTTGIMVIGNGYDVRRNQVRGLTARGATGYARGIDSSSGRHTRIDGNHIVADLVGGVQSGAGVRGPTNSEAFCGSNTVLKFTQAIERCTEFRPNVTN